MNAEQRERARRQGGELIRAAVAALDAAEARCRELEADLEVANNFRDLRESELAQLRARVKKALAIDTTKLLYKADYYATPPVENNAQYMCGELAGCLRAMQEALRGQ